MGVVKKTLALALAAAVLPGCGGDDKDGRQVVDPSTITVNAKAIFQPSAGDSAFLPFPNDLVFNGSVDFTLNIPGTANEGSAATPAAPFLADPLTAINTLDGFSTTANMVVRFSGAVDSDSLRGNLRIFKVNGGTGGKNPIPVSYTPYGVVTPLADELQYGVDFIAYVSDSAPTTGIITPLKPLEENATYLVMVTNGVLTTSGEPISADTEFASNRDNPPYWTTDGATECDYTNVPTSLATCGTFNAAVYQAAVDAGLFTAAEALQSLEPLRQAVNNQVDAALAADGALGGSLTSDDVVLAYSVTTQTITTPMEAAFTQADASGAFLNVVDTGVDSLQGAADVYSGVLAIAPQFVDPATPNSSVWQNSGENLSALNGFDPDEVTTLNLPVLITVPNQTVIDATCDAPADSPILPIAIYQHGITTNRATLLALADGLASACTIGVAIDLPKHGIPNGFTLGGTDLSALSQGSNERLVQASSAAGAECISGGTPIEYDDGGPAFHCPAGDGFINLANLANSRDTLRQASVDLRSLYTALANGDLDSTALTTVDVGSDPTNVNFIGMSLGGVAAAAFVAHSTELNTAAFNVTSGMISKLVDGSASFEPVITAGLYDSGGISKPSADYEAFLIAAQTMVDGADPINFASIIADNITNDDYDVLSQEVIGSQASTAGADCVIDGVGCPDQTVPNNFFGSAFGASWGLVAGTSQTSFLPGQNFFSTPVALAGTDPLSQGTGFVALASAVAAGAIDVPTAQGLGPLGADAVIGAPISYKGMGLVEEAAEGDLIDTNGGSLVRFIAGTHASLLDPTVSLDVTTLMQTQLVTFIATGGAVIAADPDAGTADQVVRLNTP